jgi:hypothetical protein
VTMKKKHCVKLTLILERMKNENGEPNNRNNLVTSNKNGEPNNRNNLVTSNYKVLTNNKECFIP